MTNAHSGPEGDILARFNESIVFLKMHSTLFLLVQTDGAGE
jgi:hypothetical protein